MRTLTTLLFVIIVLFGISFACLNASDVSINYFVGTRMLPLSLLLVLSLAVGAFIGFLLGVSMYWRVKRRARRLKKRLTLVEKEIENIRSLPLKEDR